jgi:hypothetical protein
MSAPILAVVEPINEELRSRGSPNRELQTSGGKSQPPKVVRRLLIPDNIIVPSVQIESKSPAGEPM